MQRLPDRLARLYAANQARAEIADRLKKEGFLLRSDVENIWVAHGLSPRTVVTDMLIPLNEVFGQRVKPNDNLNMRVFLNPQLAENQIGHVLAHAEAKINKLPTKKQRTRVT